MASGKDVTGGKCSYIQLREHRRKNLSSQIVVRRVKESGGRGVSFGFAKVLGYGGRAGGPVVPRRV